MINEERVKELYHIAQFDAAEQKECQMAVQYFQGDYIAKELIKSFFTGTIAFALCVVMYILYDVGVILSLINFADYVTFGISLLWKYALFLAAYLMITYVVYAIRYQNGYNKLKEHYRHIRKVNKMYDREEKQNGGSAAE